MSAQGLSYYPLKPARMHEVYGPGATSFATALMAEVDGQVLWVREAHGREQLHPLGLAPFFDPSRLLTANASSQVDRLAVTEEALRSSALDLVVVEITKPLSLTAGRRLQLAAKAGKCVGLCLIREGMGSNAAETRWHARPILNDRSDDSTLFHWSLIKNKSGTLGSWHVRWARAEHGAARRLDVVSSVGERPDPQSTS